MDADVEALAIKLIEACDAFRKRALSYSEDTDAVMLALKATTWSNEIEEWVVKQQKARGEA